MSMALTFEKMKRNLLKSREFANEYYKHDLPFEVGQMVLNARAMRGVSQEELAVLIGTKQPAIARIENGHLPTLKVLQSISKALNVTFLLTV